MIKRDGLLSLIFQRMFCKREQDGCASTWPFEDKKGACYLFVSPQRTSYRTSHEQTAELITADQ